MLQKFLSDYIPTDNPFIASKIVKKIINESDNPEKKVNELLELLSIPKSGNIEYDRLYLQSVISHAVKNPNISLEDLLRISKGSLGYIRITDPKPTQIKVDSEELKLKKIRRNSKGLIVKQIIKDNPYSSTKELSSKVVSVLGISENNALAHIYYQKKIIEQEK